MIDDRGDDTEESLSDVLLKVIPDWVFLELQPQRKLFRIGFDL